MSNIPENIKIKNDNHLNYLKLKANIENFLVDYDNTVNDFTSMADYDLWLTTAINLLEQVIKEKNQ